jgi:hypothetical protein
MSKNAYETLDAAWLAYNISGGKSLKDLQIRENVSLKFIIKECMSDGKKSYYSNDNDDAYNCS